MFAVGVAQCVAQPGGGAGVHVAPRLSLIHISGVMSLVASGLPKAL